MARLSTTARISSRRPFEGRHRIRLSISAQRVYSPRSMNVIEPRRRRQVGSRECQEAPLGRSGLSDGLRPGLSGIHRPYSNNGANSLFTAPRAPHFAPALVKGLADFGPRRRWAFGWLTPGEGPAKSRTAEAAGNMPRKTAEPGEDPRTPRDLARRTALRVAWRLQAFAENDSWLLGGFVQHRLYEIRLSPAQSST